MQNILDYFIHKYFDYVNKMHNTHQGLSIDEPNKYHLEDDVWTHTLMVLNSFLCYANDIKDYFNIDKQIIYIALLLHDIGKIKTKYINDSNRVVFYNHSGWSTFIAIDILNDMVENKLIETKDIKRILQLINLHDYFISNYPNDEYALYNKFNGNFYNTGFLTDYKYIINADRKGRITNETFNNNLEELINKSINIDGYFPEVLPNPTKKNIYFHIGIPYSGKTTNIDKIKQSDDIVISRDDIIMSLGYDMGLDDYNIIFNKVDQSKVDIILMQKYNAALKTNRNIHIDMTNMTRKSRRRFVVPSTYNKCAIWYLIGKTELDKRIDIRFNKIIVDKVLNRFIGNIQAPLYDEFSKIDLVLN